MRANVIARVWCRAGLLLGAVLAFTACEHEPTKAGVECTPTCEDRCGQSDGCGGVCSCESTPSPWPSCKDSCESLEQECGEVCGEACGSCDEGDDCQGGRCVCRPSCDGTRCDDGCGGSCECAEGSVCDASGACQLPAACTDSCQSASRGCGEVCGKSCGSCEDSESCLEGACVRAEGCTDCAMRLHLVERTVVDGRITDVTLALHFAPSDGELRPRMADFRIKASKDVELMSVEGGPALSEAKKSLYVDQATGKAFKRRRDGSFQLLAYGAANTRSFEPGRVVTMRFRSSELGPIAFSLVRREQTLAPPAADMLLQSSAYDQAVVVTR